MRGHIAKKGNKYYIVVDARDELTGKRKRKWLSGKDGKGFATKREAEREMPEILKRFYEGSLKHTSGETFKELMEDWLKDKKQSVRPATWKSYDWLVRMHLIPHLGDFKPDKLQPKHFRTLYNDILAPKISAASIKKLHVIVNDALNRAVSDGIIMRNPAATVELPKGKMKLFNVWNTEQLQRFLETAKQDQYYIAFELAASTGMRQSEILALRWVDVDFENKTIHVRQTYIEDQKGYQFGDTKSESSTRSIALFPDTVEALREHKRKQAEEKMANRKIYRDHGLVVQTSVGTPVNPRNLMRNFYRIIKKAGLPPIRFHDLRHTHATILLKNDAHPKIVQERLGHSSINVTLDIYSHVTPNMQEAILANIGSSITGGKNTNKSSV